jgi:hypothetical protein
MYIKEKWAVKNICRFENMEMLTVDIKFMNSPTLNIGVVYRPPDSNTMWLEKFEEYVDN